MCERVFALNPLSTRAAAMDPDPCCMPRWNRLLTSRQRIWLSRRSVVDYTDDIEVFMLGVICFLGAKLTNIDVLLSSNLHRPLPYRHLSTCLAGTKSCCWPGLASALRGGRVQSS